MADSRSKQEEIVKQLQDALPDVRAAGDALTARIKEFELWLSKLPGRVAASCVLYHHPDDEEWTTELTFHREGKEWAFYLMDCCDARFETRNVRLLRDASISDKTSAMKAFPRLLEDMLMSQQRLVSGAAQATSEFDAFAKAIGMKEGE